MNNHSIVSYDANGEGVFNTIIPKSIQELKQSVRLTCQKYFPLYEMIYQVNSFNDLIPEIDYIVDEVVKWSKPDGSGTWEYYSQEIRKNYDYNDIYSQLTFRFE
jgi:hypothetical protein